MSRPVRTHAPARCAVSHCTRTTRRGELLCAPCCLSITATSSDPLYATHGGERGSVGVVGTGRCGGHELILILSGQALAHPTPSPAHAISKLRIGRKTLIS